MVSRNDPFTGDRGRIADDLGAWCEHVHPNLRPYFECGVMRETALEVLGTLGYLEAPARWYARYPTAFIFARRLSAHETLQTLRALVGLRSSGLVASRSCRRPK